MTIYALSSGPGISGVSVIRVSGPETKNVILKLIPGHFPKPKVATLKKINKINTNELIDEGKELLNDVEGELEDKAGDLWDDAKGLF